MQRPRRPAPLVDLGGGDDLLEQAQLVVGVEDGEVGLQPDRLGMAAQDARGERVEGAEPHALGALADHRREALAHLARRLVGEGDRQHLARQGAARGEDMRQPRRQHPGLAGAGAGQHQHRPVDRGDGFGLRLVEGGEIGRSSGFRRRRSGVIDSGIGHRPTYSNCARPAQHEARTASWSRTVARLTRS